MTEPCAPPRLIANTDQVVAFDWPAGCYLQGGDVGLVVTAAGSYHTAFVEAFPPGSFIRGEGDTIAAAEAAAWAKFTRSRECATHRWEPRGYRNGAGFCADCGAFGSKVFTGAQLGQFCHACGVPTTWSWEELPADGDEPAQVLFTCREHDLVHAQWVARRARDGVSWTDVADLLEAILPSSGKARG